MPEFIDAEDVQIIVRGVVFCIVVVVALVGLAATVGLAWVVFRAVGGI